MLRIRRSFPVSFVFLGQRRRFRFRHAPATPAPPQREDSVAGGLGWIPTHGRVHVKPPFVDRLTQTPLVSSVRLKTRIALPSGFGTKTWRESR